MDHHCPWTSNCVSYTTFPHFLRFVLFAVVSISLLEYHLYIRASAIWSQRNLPSYLGPSVFSFAHLFVLLGTNSLVLFVLLILLVSAIHSLAINTTMIETWEIERHETLVKKARYQGGYVYASGGRRIRMKRQEFPYDVGIWKNLVQGMGSANVLAWLLPFDDDLDNEDAWEFEVNGFEDLDVVWPPPDPDKMGREFAPSRDIKEERDGNGEYDEVAAFKRRQREDYRRRGIGIDQEMRESRVDKKNYDWLEDDEDDQEEAWSQSEESPTSSEWVNSEGHRMRDYGVDEEAEILIEADDEDLPLGELIRRRKMQEQSSG
jgi:palmitoyltransferase